MHKKNCTFFKAINNNSVTEKLSSKEMLRLHVLDSRT